MRPKGRTLEEVVAYTIDEYFKKKYHIVDKPIRALSLAPGMVWIADELRVIEATSHEASEAGAVTVRIFASDRGRYSCPSDALVTVWHIKGRPFIVTLPDSIRLTQVAPAATGGGSPAPAHDAAGIVPFWRGPARPN